MPGTLQELGYDLARKALDQQEAVVGDVRARTGTLLTATALVATFLGARALDDGNRVLAVPGVGFASSPTGSTACGTRISSSSSGSFSRFAPAP